MLQIDTPVLDLIYAEDALPTPEKLIAALGGETAARELMVLDVDLDAPQYETEVSPTLMLRRRNDRRLLVVNESATPMRQNPRAEPIVPRDLRPERERLVRLMTDTGARVGRLQAFGSWGDAVVAVRRAVDLRAVMLLTWALDPQTDVSGRRRATPLSQREFEEKLAAFGPRLEELDDAAILARVAPAMLEEREDGLIVVDVLSDRDGSWDVRKSFELEQRVAAIDLFARLPGARVQAPPVVAADAAPDAQTTQATQTTKKTTNLRAVEAPPEAVPAPVAAALDRTPAAPVPAAEPPRPAGPPIVATDVGERVLLYIPAERFDTDTVASLARKSLDLLTGEDRVSGAQRDRIHHGAGGFVAPLAFLSEVFVEGKPLDKKRVETEARPGPEGTRLLEVHLPRFGPVLLLDGGPGKRWITSETATDPAAILNVTRQ